MFALPVSPKKTLKKQHRRGFSLVVALVMMALMLLIAISLVSFVVLESALGGYKVKRYQAQANAICGLRIALAQLQLLTGDDQRVTATADILEEGGGNNASLPTGKAYKGKRHWTGVWATGGLDKSDGTVLRDWDYKDPDKKPFLGWLVSGYDEEKGNYSPYELPVAKSSANAERGQELIKEATVAYSVDDDSSELVTLVGAGTLGKNTGWDEDVVKVRRVPMEKRTDFQKTQKTSGSFAYWVGDEGVKARVNLADNYAQDFDAQLKDWQRTLRASPQRVGVEVMAPFKSFGDWWKEDAKDAGAPGSTRLPYVLSIGDLAAYGDQSSASFLKDARALYHDVSFYSRGVFSDVYNGGLKTDLSVAFEMPWFGGEDGFEKGFRDYPQFHGSGEKNEMNLLGEFNIKSDDTTKWWLEQPKDGLGYVYEFDTKINKRGNSDGRYLRGPTWDVFRNYYRLYKRELENKGVRGLKATGETNWLATGMVPYSYLQGDKNVVRKETSVVISTGNNASKTQTYQGVFGPKWTYGATSWRGGLESRGSAPEGQTFKFVDAPIYLTEISGNASNEVKTGSVQARGSDIIKGSGIVPQAMRLAPTILRFSIKFSLVFNQDSAALLAEPLFVLHNPYNVPIEFFGIGTNFTKFYPFSLKLKRTDGGQFHYWNTMRNIAAMYSSWSEDTQKYEAKTKDGKYLVVKSNEMTIPLWLFSGNELGKSAHSLYLFAGTNSYSGSPNGSIVLQPGEIKPVFPYSKQYPIMPDPEGAYGLASSLGNFEPDPEGGMPGFQLPIAFKEMRGEGNTTFDFTVELNDTTPSESYSMPDAVNHSAQIESDIISFYLFYPEGSNGESRKNANALTRTWNDPKTSSGWGDQSDETFIQNISVSRGTFYKPSNTYDTDWVEIGKSFHREEGTGFNRASKQAICVYEVYKANADESPFAGPLMSNTRPWVVDPRAWDYKSLVEDVRPGKILDDPSENGKFSIVGPGWTAHIKEIVGMDEAETIEHTGDGNAYWGDGFGAGDGQTHVVLYEVPTRPMTSLGQFQSVDCSVFDYHPSYVIGNSYIPVGFKDRNILFDWPVAANNMPPMQPRADMPFAANMGLFDRYFFSGVNFGDEEGQEKNVSAFAKMLLEGDSQKNPLASQRVSFIRNRDDASRTDDVVREELKDPNKIARNFLYEGTFNVNSTSVEAWKAQLASLHKQYLDIDGEYSEVEDFPIIRFMKLIGKKAGGEGDGVADSGDDEGEGWRWFRSLNDGDIQELAENIVEEVRLRGPFMSMADFVNRRLNSKHEYAYSGTLQAAIDKTSRINKGAGKAKNKPDSKQFPNLIPENNPSKKAGAPGYLTQGDILSSLGAGMSVRSDTFTIRAYGDVFGLSGIPEARAYCEAVVQRLPDWVADEEEGVLENNEKTIFDSLQVKENYRSQKLDSDEHFFEKFERNTALKPVNRLLGRRYKIISFRWLSPDEI